MFESGRILMGCMQLLGQGTSYYCMVPCGMSAGPTGMSTTSGAIKPGLDHLFASLDTGISRNPTGQPAWLTSGWLESMSSGLSFCRRGLKAGKPYENLQQPLVSAASMQGTAQCARPPLLHRVGPDHVRWRCSSGKAYSGHSLAPSTQVPALEGKGAPDPDTMAADVPREALPHDDEGYLLRPGVVWCVIVALMGHMGSLHHACVKVVPERPCPSFLIPCLQVWGDPRP